MTPLERLTDLAESLGGCVVAERVPMFTSEPGRPLAAAIVVSLGAAEATFVRPTFRQAARDAESWIAAHQESCRD